MSTSINNSKAIEQQSAVRAERARLEVEIQAIDAKVTQLREMLGTLEQAEAVQAQALAQATAALADALEGSDEDAAATARKQLASASKQTGDVLTRTGEIAALRAAISALNEKANPLALRLMELAEQDKALTALRVQELAVELGSGYVARMHAVAEDVARGQALGLLALRLEVPGNFAPQIFEMPNVIGPNVGNSGRLVLPLDSARQDAVTAIVEQLRAEGFSGV